MKLAKLVVSACLAASVSSAGAATVFFDNPLTVIAHRGGAGIRPEETVLAFSHAASLDSELIFEFDVQMTSDNVAVLMHDETVDRTTNGSGTVSSFTFNDIRVLDAGYDFSTDGGATHPYRGLGLQVATLDEVLSAFPDRRMLIEVKAEAGTAAVAPVVDLIRARNMQDRVALASFDEAQVAVMRSYAPEIPTLYSQASATNLVLGLLNGTFSPTLLVDDILDLPVDLITNGVVPDFALAGIQQSLGVPIIVDTVNDIPTMQALLAKPVAGIITDRPDLLLSLVKPATPVPLPAAALLMVPALGALSAIRRRRS